MSPSASHINGLVEKFEEFTQQRAKIVRTPGYEPLCKPDLSVELEFAQAKAYRSFVGMIMYISHDRADIAYHAKTLASFLKRPMKMNKVQHFLSGSMKCRMRPEINMFWKDSATVTGKVDQAQNLQVLLAFS